MKIPQYWSTHYLKDGAPTGSWYTKKPSLQYIHESCFVIEHPEQELEIEETKVTIERMHGLAMRIREYISPIIGAKKWYEFWK